MRSMFVESGQHQHSPSLLSAGPLQHSTSILNHVHSFGFLPDVNIRHVCLQHLCVTCNAGNSTAWLYPFVDGHPPIGWEGAARYLVLPVLLVSHCSHASCIQGSQLQNMFGDSLKLYL